MMPIAYLPLLLTNWLRRTLLLLGMLLAGSALADTPIKLFKSFAGNVSFTGTQKSMRTKDNTVDPCSVNTGTMNMVLNGVPAGATILNAQLYWAGSSSTPDYTVSFDGVSVTAPANRSFVSSPIQLDFFAGAADVTTQVKAKGNATYTVGGLSITSGSPYCNNQTVLGGFQLLVVYSLASQPFRVLNIYEGFQYMQYSSQTLTLANFKIPSPLGSATGRIGHITWEGDNTLSGGGEILRYNGVEVTDTMNPSGNQFNSASNINNDSASYGIDFDAYTVASPVIQAGQTQARSDYQAGQDLVLLNAEVIAAPNVPATDHGVSMTLQTPLQPSQASNYLINVVNNGPMAEGGPIKVVDVLPSSLVFVSASGTGWACSNIDQTVTCLYSATAAAGASLPTITLRVTAAAAASGLITNSATVSGPLYDYYDGNDTSTVSTSVGVATIAPTYGFTDSVCLNGLPFGDPAQTCKLIDFNAQQNLGNDQIPMYLTYLISNVPTAVASNDTTIKLKYALACYDPIQDAGIRATFTKNHGSKVTLQLCSRSGALPGPNSAYWTSLNDVVFDGGTASSADYYLFQYADVGRIEFLVSDSSARLGTSSAFVERPERLLLVPPAGNKARNPASVSDPEFLAAGTNFSMSVQALLYGGGLAPNFGKETSPIQVSLLARPATDSTGARLNDMVDTGADPEAPLAFSGSFGAFSGGLASGAAFSYADVGVLELTPVLSAGYLGTGNIQAEAVNVGRFVPDHFKTVMNAPMVCDPNGMSCPANVDGMAYSGQPLDLQVVAQNVQNGTTKNYRGALARPVLLSAFSAPGSTTTPNPPASPSGAALTANSVTAASFVDGTASTHPVYTLPNPYVASAPYARNWVPPTMVYIRASETGSSSDGVTSLRSNAEEGGVAVVAGRLLVPNAYGSSLLPVPLQLSAQYYGATSRSGVTSYSWRANPSDSSTSLTLASALQYSNCGLVSCPTLASGAAAVLTMSSGSATTSLKAGTSSAKSAADVKVNGPGWLPTTQGRVTFGVYRSPVIFLREVY
ncbi:hypothetical protein GTP23_20840 [Pseudoduganella sp. FT93W]|uniref:DUF11 domain-containing protein n=1 Tax=Duganella fentianensis TaxID=2692177 RepID=A0A845I6A7_9BURK|nr:DUF6701 domain-containing protein [Duganella fentianensis]MYN47496.1 hypothetical protein [Duganella fentianensis]